MNTSQTENSWLDLVGSTAEVLGPSRGHIPDLAQYRISRIWISLESIWLFGAVPGMPPDAEVSGEKDGVVKFNLALQVHVRALRQLSGNIELDQLDDSMHGFELALPVQVTLRATDELAYPWASNFVLELRGKSKHLNFDIAAESVFAYGGKHARKRFLDACRLPHSA